MNTGQYWTSFFSDTLKGLLDKIPTRVGPRYRYDQKTPAAQFGGAHCAVNVAIENEVIELDRVLTYVRGQIRAMLAFCGGKGRGSALLIDSLEKIKHGHIPPAW